MSMPNEKVSPNVYGIETEYSCMVTLPDTTTHELVGECHSLDVPLQLYKAPKENALENCDMEDIVAAVEAQGLYMTEMGMLSNGGRLYVDQSGFEYATPETTTAEEAVVRSFDGDQIILGVLQYLREAEIIQSFQLNRRGVDHNRSSRGVHHNLTSLLRRDVIRGSDVTKPLAALNVLKGAICGAGSLLLDSKGATDFHHAPRLSITKHTAQPKKHWRQKALVRWPYENDGTKFARVENISEDALNFAWPMRAGLVATNALIKMIELGYSDRLPILKNPVLAAHTVGKHGSEAPVSIVDKRQPSGTYEANPLEILRDICSLAFDIDEEHGFLDLESVQVLNEIIEVSDKMEQDPASVANQVESVARKLAMDKKQAKHEEEFGVKLELGSERMCRFDYAWDWLGGNGIAEQLRSKGKVGWQGFKHVPSVRRSQKLRNMPPSDTRANIRGNIIYEERGLRDVDWLRIETHYIHPLESDLITELEVQDS